MSILTEKEMKLIKRMTDYFIKHSVLTTEYCKLCSFCSYKKKSKHDSYCPVFIAEKLSKKLFHYKTKKVND